MRYVEAPSRDRLTVPRLFLAGGITGCPDWQTAAKHHLSEEDVTLLNPRRADFPIGDPSAARAQIAWEYAYLQLADAILFWFPCETLCPIVLFELGRWSGTNKPIFVGSHPDYKRLQDVDIQLRLARPDVRVVGDLPALCGQVKTWLQARRSR